MASIHVIYDPTDKLSTNPEHLKELGIKVAIMPLAEGTTYINATHVIETLARMLVDQLGVTRD